ncbi:PREDICTED: WD repeat-containing protein 35-like, partial [Amphimedon queenslandica]
MDRKDLAIELRVKLGHWFRVLQLLKSDGSLATDVQMAQAWNSIGDYYAERDMWEHALGYYTQASNTELMAKAFFILEKFDSLESLADGLPVNHPLLP